MRRAVVVAAVAALGAAVGVVAFADDPPPRVAFVARGDDPADAMAVGPVAGGLRAPIFTTASDRLVAAAAQGLAAHDPDMVVIVGGTAAISGQVEDQVRRHLGLADDQLLRVSGGDRYDTAAQVAGLFDRLGAAFLPLDGTATAARNADTVDGLHADELGDVDVVYRTDTFTRSGATDPYAFASVTCPQGMQPVAGVLHGSDVHRHDQVLSASSPSPVSDRQWDMILSFDPAEGFQPDLQGLVTCIG